MTRHLHLFVAGTWSYSNATHYMDKVAGLSALYGTLELWSGKVYSNAPALTAKLC